MGTESEPTGEVYGLSVGGRCGTEGACRKWGTENDSMGGSGRLKERGLEKALWEGDG